MNKLIFVFICLCVGTVLISSCGANDPLNPDNPVSLTMWHNFGGDMQQTMDGLIDEFNDTIGKERGVIVSVEAISASANLQDAMTMILKGDPGAPEMPDIATAYPSMAIKFQAQGRIVNLNDYFTEDELSAYVPAFVDEGRIGDGLYVFPFAKSTELLFVNQTLFDRFAADTVVTMECFDTFEGIADAAVKYHDWSGGKDFYTADSWINVAQSGMLQKGASLFEGESLSLDNDTYRYIWDTCFTPSVNGGFAIYDGYSSDLSKTGDIICSTGSSAGILFYGNTITYPDNVTTEEVEYSVLPYPVFEGGENIAIQRGNGFIVAKSDEQREYAAALFLKWFTAPEQNMEFVAETGYLPVTNEAFEAKMPQRMETVENPYIRQMLQTVMNMYESYDFFTAPAFESFDSVSDNYEQQYKDFLRDSDIINPDEAYSAFIIEAGE